MFELVTRFRIRVTDDDKHAIFASDFDAFEDLLIQICLQEENLGKFLPFEFGFFPTGDDEDIDQDV